MEVVYGGFKITANPFDAEKEIAFYKLTIELPGGSMVKTFKSASGRAARFFDTLKIGTPVKITRHGVGSETKYEFSVVGSEAKEAVGEGEEEGSPF